MNRRQAIKAAVATVVAPAAAIERIKQAEDKKLMARLIMEWLNSPAFIAAHRRYVPGMVPGGVVYRGGVFRLTVKVAEESAKLCHKEEEE